MFSHSFIRSPLFHTGGIDILRSPSVHHHEVDNNRANLPTFETPTEHIGPHLSNEHTANNCALDHFYARIRITMFVHERTIPSNLMSGLTSWLQFRVDLRCSAAKSKNILTMIKRTSIYRQSLSRSSHKFRLKSKRISFDKMNNCLFLTEGYCIYIICISDFIPFFFLPYQLFLFFLSE